MHTGNTQPKAKAALPSYDKTPRRCRDDEEWSRLLRERDERREILIECGKTDSNGRQEDSTKIQKQAQNKYQEKYIKSKTRAREAA
jgi:hypothetical protein